MIRIINPDVVYRERLLSSWINVQHASRNHQTATDGTISAASDTATASASLRLLRAGVTLLLLLLLPRRQSPASLCYVAG